MSKSIQDELADGDKRFEQLCKLSIEYDLRDSKQRREFEKRVAKLTSSSRTMFGDGGAFLDLVRKLLPDWDGHSDYWGALLPKLTKLANVQPSEFPHLNINLLEAYMKSAVVDRQTCTIEEAAGKLRLDRGTIYRHIKSGRLATLEGTKLPLRSAVENFLPSPTKKRQVTPKRKASARIKQWREREGV